MTTMICLCAQAPGFENVRRGGGKDPNIRNFGTRWKQAVTFTLWPAALILIPCAKEAGRGPVPEWTW
jgi:hypothetical protein